MLRISKRLLFRALAVVLVFGAANTVGAQEACRKTQVFFMNGVWNPHGYQAMQSAVELSETLNATLAANGLPQIVNVRNLWNPGDGLRQDLEEVALDQSKLRIAISTWLGREMNAPAALARQRQSIDKVKSAVMEEIKNNTPVVLIAHSQGNIMVNQAIRELRDQYASEYPQVMNIAIVGIAVADKSPVGRFYSYITSATDEIIRLVSGALPANFTKTSSWPPANINPLVVLSELFTSEHPISSVYLNAAYKGTYDGAVKSSAQVIGDLFLKAFANVNAAWPCITVTPSPASSVVGEPTSFQVAAKARPGDPRIPQGTVTVKSAAGAGSSYAALCTSNLAADGTGQCQATFGPPDREVKLLASFRANPPFESWDSAAKPHFIGPQLTPTPSVPVVTPTVTVTPTPLPPPIENSSCKPQLDIVNAEFVSINNRRPSNASLTADLQTLLYMTNKVVVTLQQYCQGQPEFADLGTYQSTYTSAMTTCLQVVTDSSSCVPRVAW